MTVKAEFECVGRVELGALSAQTESRLLRLGGEWLEFSPEERAVVVRHVQPDGTPAVTAVPSELIAIIDALLPAERDALPGGTIVMREPGGATLRLVVERGDIRIQWPSEDWTHAVPVEVDQMLRTVDPFHARVSGKLSFTGAKGADARLVDLVDGFEGLYPADDLDVVAEGSTVRATLRGVNVGPSHLLGWLRELAQPVESLEADLDIGAFGHHAQGSGFRLTVRGGVATAVRPLLWRQS